MICISQGIRRWTAESWAQHIPCHNVDINGDLNSEQAPKLAAVYPSSHKSGPYQEGQIVDEENCDVDHLHLGVRIRSIRVIVHPTYDFRTPSHFFLTLSLSVCCIGLPLSYTPYLLPFVAPTLHCFLFLVVFSCPILSLSILSLSILSLSVLSQSATPGLSWLVWRV